MNLKAKCPNCQKSNLVPLDINDATQDAEFNELVECSCGETFILRATLCIETKILAMVLPSGDENWGWRNKAKKLITELELLIAKR